MARIKAAERAEAIARLKQWLKPGMTVYTILRNVSRSGMMRHVTPIIFDKKGEPSYLTYNAAVALGWPMVSGGVDAIKISGGGMDMGFHLVYSLGQVLYGDGYKLKQRWL